MAAAEEQTILAVDIIRMDGGTQPRAELNQSHVEELVEVLNEGHTFKDPVVVFYDGTDYWLADGFHRVNATKRTEYITIHADVRSGTLEDAIAYSCGANATHGLRRTNEDKQRAVNRLLTIPRWQEESNVKIAAQCGVTEHLVRIIKDNLPEEHPASTKSRNRIKPPVEPIEEVEEVEEVRISAPTNEEKRRKVLDFFKDFPGSQELSNREIARRCDVDEGFIRKIKKELQEERQRLEQEEVAHNASVTLPEPVAEPANETEQPTEETSEPDPTPEDDQAHEEIEQESAVTGPEAAESIQIVEEPAIENDELETENYHEEDAESEPNSLPVANTEEAKQEEPTPTISGVIVPTEEVLREREIKRQQIQERNEQLRERGAELPEGKYACLVIDPPWPMKKIEREVRPNQVEFDYPTMTEDELKAFPLPDMAGDDCHLYLWTTQKYLPMALRLAGHWGFKYQCLMTWVKNVGPTPFSWMYTTEHVLFCSKGNLPLLAIGRRLDFIAKGREHSRKPDEFYELVKEVSPGPRLDIFSREKRDGFDQYGNEVEKYVSA